MNLSLQQLAAALDAISGSVAKAENHYRHYFHFDDEWAYLNAEWYLRLAYSQLAVLCETLDLPLFRKEVMDTLRKAEESKDDGILEEVGNPDGETGLKWAESARRYREALQTTLLTEPSQTVTKDLETVLRSMTYAITDPATFGHAPRNEGDVHQRIETILRCFWSDLLHKPRLTKAIKHFEPDTGIPSINTLIEYKYVGFESDCKRIADEILADTRGYKSREWKSFVFVIYETERFRPESQWRQLLHDCDTSENTTVIVLTGTSSIVIKNHKSRKLPSAKRSRANK